MKTLSLLLPMAILSVMFASCGESEDNSGEEVGCEWFTGDNCWKSSLNTAKNCLPPGDATGTLSQDGTTCTYEDGTKVIFNNPYDSSALDNDNYEWDFEVRSDSGTCLSYKESDGEIFLTTSAGTFQVYNSALLALTCPDGSKYTANGFKILSCENGINNLPGASYSWQPDFIYFSLLGMGDESLQVFQCSR